MSPNDQNNHQNPSVYYLHPFESIQKIISHVFNGTGYSTWKRAMTIALSRKNKICFVDGSLESPGANSPHIKD